MKLESSVLDQMAVLDFAIVNRTVFNADASGALLQIGKVDPVQAAQRSDLRQVEMALIRNGQNGIALDKAGDRLLKFKEFNSMT